ncbi:MAG TPA: hypothetical protein VFZ36_06455 [Vicinamibacterales bacterium]
MKPDERPLESWKEIAAHLKRDATTVRRWEKSRGLPVHRHLHESRSSVFAYRSELDAWWAGRSPAQKAADTALTPGRPGALRLAALAAALLLSIATSGDRIVRSIEPAAQAQGLTARQLWAGSAVDTTGDVMPGGKLISFVDWETGDLAVRDVAAGSSRRITGKGTWADSFEFALYSAFSPDARQLAYAWFTKDLTFELRTMPVEGGAARTLFSAGVVGNLQPAGWTPDGAHVLTVLTRRDNTNQIALISTADGAARVLKSLDWRAPLAPALSDDGRFVAFDLQPNPVSPQRDIFAVSVDGARETPLVQHPANDYLPAWTPDGSSIVFLSDRSGNVDLWIMPVANGIAAGPARLLRPGMGRVSSMTFDRDGSLYYSVASGMSDVFVATIDIDAGMVIDQPAPLSSTFVGSNSGAEWSPDGTRIAYLSRRLPSPPSARNSSIVVRSIAEGTERVLTVDLTAVRRPRWSPDGKRLLMFAQDAKGQRAIYTVDAETGAASLLFGLEGEPYTPAPVWSADGKSVFYTYLTNGEFVLRMRDLASGHEKVVARTNALGLVPSPDGKWIAYTDPGTGKPAESHLVVSPIDGGTPRRIVTLKAPETFATDSVAWSRDGRHLLFVKRNAQPSLFKVPAAGGEPQPLDIAMSGATVGLRLHPDGRRVAFTSGEPMSEFWVLQGLLPSR